jgi:YHS domain-containing protein
MIRLLIWALLIYIGYKVVVSLFAGKKNGRVDRDPKRPDSTTTYQDPVCGVFVSEEDAVVGKLDGQRHYFCSMACLDKFRDQLEHTSHT